MFSFSISLARGPRKSAQTDGPATGELRSERRMHPLGLCLLVVAPLSSRCQEKDVAANFLRSHWQLFIVASYYFDGGLTRPTIILDMPPYTPIQGRIRNTPESFWREEIPLKERHRAEPRTFGRDLLRCTTEYTAKVGWKSSRNEFRIDHSGTRSGVGGCPRTREAEREAGRMPAYPGCGIGGAGRMPAYPGVARDGTRRVGGPRSQRGPRAPGATEGRRRRLSLLSVR